MIWEQYLEAWTQAPDGVLHCAGCDHEVGCGHEPDCYVAELERRLAAP